MKTLTAITVIAGLVALSSAPARAQTSPTSDARPDFSGTWSLDRSLSTDLTQVNLIANANRLSGGRSRGGIGIGGGLGRQRGGGGNSAGRGTADALTPDEQAKLKVLTDQLKTASATLVITHREPSFIVSDAQGNALFFETDRPTDDNHLAGETLTSSTQWDEARLATDYVLGSHLTLVYTYTLLPKTNQLVVRVARKADSSARPAANPEVKLVYKLTPP